MVKTKSELVVHELCERSFLSMWTIPNPLGKKKGKELCDVLVVFDPYIIIISVKEIQFKDKGDYQVASKRWEREAIDKSVSQIYGAEKLISKPQFYGHYALNEDGSSRIKFPSIQDRIIIRIAIAFGNCGKTSYSQGDFGEGFVHVFDDIAIKSIMKELDTISDFCEYFKKKENYLYLKGETEKTNPRRIFFEGGEEDLLAYYLQNDHQFPSESVFLAISNGIYDEYTNSARYHRKSEENKISYLWDDIIDRHYFHFKNGELLTQPSDQEFELVLRTMAKENRLSRRNLSKNFILFLEKTKQNPSGRYITNGSGITYVFQTNEDELDHDKRREQLYNRCIFARCLFPQNSTVIGIATEVWNENGPSPENSYDLLMYVLEDLSPEMIRNFENTKKELGISFEEWMKPNVEYEFPPLKSQ